MTNKKLQSIITAKKWHTWVFAIMALSIPTLQTAQDLNSEVDKIFSWVTPTSPGCVCAVEQNGKVIIHKAYGLADLERNVPLTTESVFDIGSVVKQFVAAAMLLLVEDGKLSLTDDVRKYIPELPDYGHTITIDHLITHTSGIRDWTGILPFTRIKEDALTLTLRQEGLNFIPGEEWSYSNSGFVLAKEIVARVSQKSFGKFVEERLFNPLGMTSSVYLHDMWEIVSHRALAYQKQGDHWKTELLMDEDRGGGGGMLSTAGDLLIWNAALTNGKLGPFITQKIQERATLSNGRKLDYGRGLFLETYPKNIVWHSGSAGAYKSLVSRFPDQKISMAILCNSGDGTDRHDFGKKIFDLLSPESDKIDPEGPPPIAEGIDTTGLHLSARTGLYFNDVTGESIQLAMQEGRLRIVNGPFLVARTKDRFRRWKTALQYRSQDAFEIDFMANDQFQLRSMEGKITLFQRAKAFSPTPSDLDAFAGRYESEEIGTTFKISARQNSLEIQLEHKPENSLEFRPVDTDTFQWGRMTVRFHRDDNGDVTGFLYTNPVIRNIPFSRQATGT